MYDADAPAEPAGADKLILTDQDFLAIVGEQRRQAIGFENDQSSDLQKERELALQYIKGEMPDIPNPDNRSKAVSTDVSDAIQTALPDLIEIFIGGDDVATFQATGAEDEEAAKAETEYVLQNVFDYNDGFLLLCSIIWDALACKQGIAKTWWEAKQETTETEASVPADTLPMVHEAAASQGAEIANVQADEATGMATFTVRHTKDTGCIRNVAVPPEDFAYARDTVALRDTAYCAMRSRPRAQSLVEQGYDADDIDSLPEYTDRDEASDQARDTVGESDQKPTSSANRGLRTVEIVEHYVRVDADGDGKTEIWQVVTGGGETVLLRKEKVTLIPFAAITPYIVPHRLMGRSLADLLLEIQRIKTALLRMLLDSGYFALNQRNEVAMEQANEWTISDLLRNEPGAPIRSKNGAAVRAVTAGALAFDVTGALEYVSTIAEQRTGIVRNAQGLNPDTLHDTAAGAQQLIGAAQKRIRLIARTFAETGIKDLFLNVHELLRLHGREVEASIGGKWARVDPTTWPERKGLKVEIGVGSGGREHDLMAGNQLIGMLQAAVTAQGGLTGPLTNVKAISAAAKRQTERLGFKNGEQYWPDPEQFQAPPTQPDPKVVEAQAKAQLQQQQMQNDHALALQKQATDERLRAQESEAKARQAAIDSDRAHALRQQEMNDTLNLKREQLAAELTLKQRQMEAEAQLKVAGMAMDAHTAAQNASIGSDVHPGGEPG